MHSINALLEQFLSAQSNDDLAAIRCVIESQAELVAANHELLTRNEVAVLTMIAVADQLPDGLSMGAHHLAKFFDRDISADLVRLRELCLVTSLVH
jgi:hypothetical protein